MDDELQHHGILGQKWGVRRTPAQLGHEPGGKKKASDGETKKKPKLSEMSDDELRQRINRLNMEEQYANLVSRANERNTGPVKKLCLKALSKIGEKSVDAVVNGLFEAMKTKEKGFDISDWKDKDVDSMSPDTISKVASWYENAAKIERNRSKVSGGK